MYSRIIIILIAFVGLSAKAEYNPYDPATNPFTQPNWQRQQQDQPRDPEEQDVQPSPTAMPQGGQNCTVLRDYRGRIYAVNCY